VVLIRVSIFLLKWKKKMYLLEIYLFLTFGFSLVFQIPLNSFPEFEMVSTCSVNTAKP